jgi:hypothetical protein
MDLLNFEDYFYEVWEMVPQTIVSDRDFDRNRSLIQEITFEYWNIYKNTAKEDEFSLIRSEMGTVRCSNLMCVLFKSFKQIGFKF